MKANKRDVIDVLNAKFNAKSSTIYSEQEKCCLSRKDLEQLQTKCVKILKTKGIPKSRVYIDGPVFKSTKTKKLYEQLQDKRAALLRKRDSLIMQIKLVGIPDEFLELLKEFD